MGKNNVISSRPGFIREIDGVRGIALTLVVLFHLFGNGRTSGGVDVFLVISAFLLTGSLLRRLEKPQGLTTDLENSSIRGSWSATKTKLGLGAHFAKVATRLVPSAAVVITAVGLGAYFFAPSSQLRQIFRESVASALYFENWELISSQLAYSAAGPTSSPLQHFWSLSVQGQFFLVWPLLFLLIGVVVSYFKKNIRRTLLVMTLVLTATSMVYAFWLVQVDQPVAYLNSFARFWQLGFGASVAFLPAQLQIPNWLRESLIWAGIGLMIFCGFVVDGGALFPGPAALWPVTAIVLVFIGTRGMSTASSAAKILSVQPFPFLSKISYQLYLWHWPFLVFYLIVKNQNGVSWRGGLLIFSTSILAAYLTEKLVHRPYSAWNLRVPSVRRLVPSIAVVTIVAVAFSAGAQIMERRQTAELLLAAQESPDHPGAMVLTESAFETFNSTSSVRPSFDAAQADVPELYDLGCVQNWRDDPSYSEVLVCEDVRTAARKRIVVSGGSHVLHWYPALREVADQQNWELFVVDKDGCRLSAAAKDEGLNNSCHVWNESAVEVIADLRPDALFTVATKTPETVGSNEIMYEGQVRVWETLEAEGIPTIAIRDTPRFEERVPDCLNGTSNTSECARPRAEIFAETLPLPSKVKIPASTHLLDLTNGFCGSTECEPIVGNVTAYRDQDHMTATFSRTLAPLLERELRKEVPWLFAN